MERWNNTYHYSKEIADASDEQLIEWLHEATTWNIFSMGCLHELAWRSGIEWSDYSSPDELFDWILEDIEWEKKKDEMAMH